AVECFNAVRELKRLFPFAKTSGGVSNVSFSFRGNEVVREAINAVFLYHAIKAGLDMGIVNPGQLQVYEEIPKDLLEHVEDVVLNRRPDATERLLKFAKNIVGVVLGCNDYEVIDLGVMTPCERILDEARKHGVDMIGLSGLITPSLDEMVHVAKEMKREGFTIPLLIGGATTSAKHTAVRIAPCYGNITMYVKDASRCVGVVDRLMRPEARRDLDRENRDSQEKDRESYRKRRER